MFTGVTEAMAEVRWLRGAELRVQRPRAFRNLKRGSSVAVSGVCLTVTGLSKGEVRFDVSPETIRATTLGSLTKGDRVNLERPLPAHGRLDGHVVQGHVDGVGRISRFSFLTRSSRNKKRETSASLEMVLPAALSRYVIAKGSITVDGVSLTIAKKKGNRVMIALIPETIARTTLGNLKKGDRVNIETDMIGKYVAAFLKKQ